MNQFPEGVTLGSDSWGNRFHLFEQADGSRQPCGGPKLCRECIREHDRRQAARRSA